MSRAPKAVDGLSFTADDLVAMRGANEAAKAARAARGGDLFGYGGGVDIARAFADHSNEVHELVPEAL